jgi:hypothetical protein
MTNLIETPEFFLWSEIILLWSVIAYGVSSDPLPEDSTNATFAWTQWKTIATARVVFLVSATFFISASFSLTLWMLLIAIAQPWLRYKLPNRWTAEIETAAIFTNLFVTLILIRNLKLEVHRAIQIPLTAEQISAICITAATMLFVVRGGTYIVRGFLRKSQALPKKKPAITGQRAQMLEVDTTNDDGSESVTVVSEIEIASEEPSLEVEKRIDTAEVKRGRLIGNLERLLLTLVVAAGSYAALAFLIAAKGLIRSNELQDREFAEYFLIGSLSSVLVSLCAGIALRFAVLALWPELLSLQMQGS